MADELAPDHLPGRTPDAAAALQLLLDFDSAPQVGNLAAAMAALCPAAAHPLVAILGGQLQPGALLLLRAVVRQCGAEGAVHRIDDRHPTMSRHPVTPCTRPTCAAISAARGWRIELVDWRVLDDEARLDGCWTPPRASPRRRASTFCTSATSPRLGRQLWQRAAVARLLAVGASSVAQALLAHWRASGQLAAEAPAAGITRPPRGRYSPSPAAACP